MAHKTRGAILRSRTRWHEHGERNNKYFYSLEKRNYSRKSVTKLKLNDGSFTTNQFDILEEQKKFYETLYQSQVSDSQDAQESDVFFNLNSTPTLSEDEQALCEGLITQREALNALKDFSADKTPGTDGLPAEFLRYFWPELQSSIVGSFNYAFQNGSLSISQRRGIISLIPKKNKDKTILENLRPISLLNVDYKILTKILAKRLEKVLPKLINPDQTGYVKGRYIGENIRLIQDLMFYTEKENLPGIAVFLDFRKAFDTIEWHYLEKALTHFNFGPNFLHWFKILHTDISSCVLNNGHASRFFSIKRGVRQGCPLSGLLFVIGLELLARAVKRDALIKGITIGNKEIKISMYADDTTVFVNDTDSILHLLNMLEKFRSISGLQVNTSKTEALWLGCWKDRRDTPFNFKWPEDPICALGVFFSYNTLKADKLNFDDKLRSMEKILNIWKCRRLTLIGKINIVKTLALSKLIFNSSNLYLPPHVIDAANKMIFDFIWEGKPPKIKKSTITGEKANGGLKMIDFGLMEIALKIAWIQRIRQNSDAAWKVIPEYALSHLGGFAFLLDCRYDLNLLQLHDLPPFYHSVLKYWQDYRPMFSEDMTQAQNEIIWNNSNILINKSTIFFKQWYRSGIIRIQDLLDVDFTFLSLDKFQRKFHLQVPFTTYYGLINAIPSSWRRKLKSTNSSTSSGNSSQESSPKNITTHSAYAAILDHFFQAPTAETRILRYGFSKESLTNVYKLPFLITREVNLQMFQYKIIHNILPTRCSLFRAKLSESDTCRLCYALPETLPHMLFQCTVISTFWHAFQNWWFEKTLQTFDLSERNVIYGWYNNTQFKDTLNYDA